MLSETFSEALTYCYKLHCKQQRKGTEIPYVSHLLQVAGMVLEAGAEEEVAIAALLHDAVEDQGGDETALEIEQRFGGRVAQLVLSLSDSHTIPKPPWRKRKEAFLARLRNGTPDMFVIAAADKLHNLRSILNDHASIGEEIWSRFNGGRDGTLWYYQEVADILQEKFRSSLTEQFLRENRKLQQLA